MSLHPLNYYNYRITLITFFFFLFLKNGSAQVNDSLSTNELKKSSPDSVLIDEHALRKVIVKQIEGGDKIFWSIIPFWGMDEQTKSRLLYEGLPEED